MNDTPLLLSVSGMRGIVGQSLTEPVVSRYAMAFGRWLKRRGLSLPVVVVGRDSRPSGRNLETAVAEGLVRAGCRPIRLGIVSTPGVAVMLKSLGADGGLIVTASHNPQQWNGIKALRGDATAPAASEVEQIIELYQQRIEDSGAISSVRSVGSNAMASQVHCEVVLDQIDVDLIRKAKFRVVVDSVCGAGGSEVATLLKRLGVDLIHLHANPTGHFPHGPEPLKENLSELCAAVCKHDAQIGFAQDPDADRLAIVDEHASYIGEEYTLAFCVLHTLQDGQVTVANLSTSRMIDDIAARVGATVERTAVGEANVAAAIRRHGAMIGGEGNGGVIWGPVCHVRDSLVSMALVLELLAKRKCTVSDAVQSIPRYAIVKEKFPMDPRMVGQLGPRLNKCFASQQIDEQDGVRIDYSDRWIHVRPSNTEPILRLIAEASTEADARSLIAEARKALESDPA